MSDERSARLASSLGLGRLPSVRSRSAPERSSNSTTSSLFSLLTNRVYEPCIALEVDLIYVGTIRQLLLNPGHRAIGTQQWRRALGALFD